jgi:hypothetical protein
MRCVKVLELLEKGEITKDEAMCIIKLQRDDMLRANGGRYNCRACHYTRHVDCPDYCK